MSATEGQAFASPLGASARAFAGCARGVLRFVSASLNVGASSSPINTCVSILPFVHELLVLSFNIIPITSPLLPGGWSASASGQATGRMACLGSGIRSTCFLGFSSLEQALAGAMAEKDLLGLEVASLNGSVGGAPAQQDGRSRGGSSGWQGGHPRGLACKLRAAGDEPPCGKR